jgi:hypothetical protein
MGWAGVVSASAAGLARAMLIGLAWRLGCVAIAILAAGVLRHLA